MSDYVFAYHMERKPETPEEGAELMQKWTAWVSEMGDALINPGSPLGMSKTVSSDGVADNGGSNPLAGYSVVRADTMDAALELAKGCPHLEIGTIEVAEVMSM